MALLRNTVNDPLDWIRIPDRPGIPVRKRSPATCRSQSRDRTRCLYEDVCGAALAKIVGRFPLCTRSEANALHNEIALLQQRLTKSLAGEKLLLDSIEHLIAGAQYGATSAPETLKVSVILPVRNRSKLVPDAIASVLMQSWRSLELIVVDDGSQESVAQLVERQFPDPRVTVLRQDPSGVSAARNAGLRHASGDLIAYLDSDNVWTPGFVTAMARAFEVQPNMHAAYGMLLSRAHGRDTGVLFEPFNRSKLEAGNYIDINVFVHRRNLYERYGGFDEELDRLVDWDLILRYTAQVPAIALPVWGAIYRILDRQRISDTVSLHRNLFRVQEKLSCSGSKEI